MPAGPAPTLLTQEQVAQQRGTYVEMRDGLEVPFSRVPLSDLVNKAYQPPSPKKRKAATQPDGEPAPKAAKSHGGGLLAAVEAMEEEDDAPSNAPSPQNEGPSPEEGASTPEDDDIMMPRAAGEPDEFGLRLISKKPNRADPVPNNRIMVPNIFEWDDHEIGFRDSTNKWTAAKKNTKRFRGKYTDKPNSNYLFLDRRVIAYDSTDLAEDDFDKEAIQKYGLHPTLGIVLPTSTNASARDEENYYEELSRNPPPVEQVDHAPRIFQGQAGEQFTTSRAWALMFPRHKLWQRQRKSYLARLVQDFCEDMEIDPQDIEPTPEDREEYRRNVMVEMGLDPDQQMLHSESEEADAWLPRRRADD